MHIRPEVEYLRQLFEDLKAWTTRDRASLQREIVSYETKLTEEEIIPIVREYLSDSSYLARDIAVQIIGNRRFMWAIDALIKMMMEDDEKEVRFSAAEALGKIGHDSAIPALKAVVLDKQQKSSVRQYATGALGEIGNPIVIDTLMALIVDNEETDGFVHEQASEGLIAIGGEVVEAKIVAALEGVALVYGNRCRLIGMLAEINGEKYFDFISQFLRHENQYVRLTASLKLKQIDRQKTKQLIIPLLNDESSDLRRVAKGILDDTDHVSHDIWSGFEESMIYISSKGYEPIDGESSKNNS